MKKILLFCLVAFASLNTQAKQNATLDQLDRVLQSKQGVEKVAVFGQIVELCVSNKNWNDASKYLNEASTLSKELNNAKVAGDVAFWQGLIFKGKFDYANAMEAFVEALRIRNGLTDQVAIANVKEQIGVVFYLEKNNEQALENLQEVLTIREKSDDVAGSANTYKAIGDVYLQKKIYGQANEAYRKAMDLKIQAEDIPGASNISSFLGSVMSDLGDHEGALVYFNRSLDLDNSVGNVEKIGEDYNHIAKAYVAMNAFEEAKEANDMAYKIRKDLKNEVNLAETHLNYGVIYNNLNQMKKSKDELKQCVRLLRKNSNQQGADKIYLAVSQAYGKLKDYKKAYAYQKAYSKSRDAIFNREKSEALLKLTTRYESEFAAAEQAQEIETLVSTQKHNAKIKYFLMALVGLGVVLASVLFMSWKRSQKANEELTEKNLEIRSQKSEIDEKNMELEGKNTSLDMLNMKLVEEIAERENIEQSSFARDRFLATMSHEMRTPMNIIIGLAHLLLEEEPRPDQVEHLRTLQFSANNLIVFINDVLDFSKIEAGKLNLESRVFNPKGTFDDTKERFGLPARDKGLDLNYNFDSKIPDALMGDPTRLNQIVTNLVSNAINHTDSGEVNVDVTLNNLDQREATILITIEDTGAGIEEDKLEEMFKKFSRKGADIFEGYAGTGLGLAITKRLVDLQNGKIEVDSKAGVGTKFTIYLPYKLANPEMIEAARSKTPVGADGKADYSHLKGQKILLVEDNRINQLVVAKMLRRLDIEVVTTDNGAEALDAFNESYFDLVLMDIQMPVMDGYRATAEIRKSTDPRKRDVPIIALTASAFLTEKDKAKLFGMNDHVGKPFGPEDLLDKIGACLAVYKSI